LELKYLVSKKSCLSTEKAINANIVILRAQRINKSILKTTQIINIVCEEFKITEQTKRNSGKYQSSKPLSIEQLVDYLAFDGIGQGYLDFVKTFLLTFRSFTTVQEFGTIMKQRYSVMNTQKMNLSDFNTFRKPIQIRIANVLVQWLKNYPYDFQGDNIKCRDLVLELIENYISDEHMALSKQIRKHLVKASTDFQSEIKDSYFENIEGLSLFEETAEAIGDQLTLCEWNIYKLLKVI
jgi:hypothetical protein